MKTLLVAVLVALVAPVAAQAKELTAVTLCGASGCATNDNLGLSHVAPFTEESLLPASPGPYYRIELTVDGHPNAFGNAYYVPSAGRVAFANEEAWTQWARPVPELEPLLRDLAGKVEPLTVPTVTGAFVGTRRVKT